MEPHSHNMYIACRRRDEQRIEDYLAGYNDRSRNTTGGGRVTSLPGEHPLIPLKPQEMSTRDIFEKLRVSGSFIGEASQDYHTFLLNVLRIFRKDGYNPKEHRYGWEKHPFCRASTLGRDEPLLIIKKKATLSETEWQTFQCPASVPVIIYYANPELQTRHYPTRALRETWRFWKKPLPE